MVHTYDTYTRKRLKYNNNKKGKKKRNRKEKKKKREEKRKTKNEKRKQKIKRALRAQVESPGDKRLLCTGLVRSQSYETSSWWTRAPQAEERPSEKMRRLPMEGQLVPCGYDYYAVWDGPDYCAGWLYTSCGLLVHSQCVGIINISSECSAHQMCSERAGDYSSSSKEYASSTIQGKGDTMTHAHPEGR